MPEHVHLDRVTEGDGVTEGNVVVCNVQDDHQLFGHLPPPTVNTILDEGDDDVVAMGEGLPPGQGCLHSENVGLAAINMSSVCSLPHPCALDEVSVGSESVEASVPGLPPALSEGDPAGVPEPGVRNDLS